VALLIQPASYQSHAAHWLVILDFEDFDFEDRAVRTSLTSSERIG